MRIHTAPRYDLEVLAERHEQEQQAVETLRRSDATWAKIIASNRGEIVLSDREARDIAAFLLAE